MWNFQFVEFYVEETQRSFLPLFCSLGINLGKKEIKMSAYLYEIYICNFKSLDGIWKIGPLKSTSLCTIIGSNGTGKISLSQFFYMRYNKIFYSRIQVNQIFLMPLLSVWVNNRSICVLQK